MNHEKQYYLMHRDEMVTILSVDTVSGSVVKVGEKIVRELLPPGGNQSPEDLKRWWKHRAVPLSQGNIERILKDHRIAGTQNFLLKNMGLSLTDQYWLNPVDDPLSWEKVNLFTNNFKDEVGELQIYGGESPVTEQIPVIGQSSVMDQSFLATKPTENIYDLPDFQNRTTFYPSASAQGELRKKWVIRQRERYLVKGNYGTSYQQSINEVFATMLHQRQNKMPYVSYELCTMEVDGESKLGCMCKNFVDIQTEFIPAYDVACSVKKRNDQSEYEHFISVCVSHGMCEMEVREFLEYQILSDFVLTNTDRHFHNFGVIRDAKSLKWMKMAPIFDSGNSLFWNHPLLPLANDLLDISVNSFLSREVDLLKYVRNRMHLDLTLLPTEEELNRLLAMDVDYENRKEGVLTGYRKKIQLLEKFQSGENIFQYKYGKK